MDVWQIVVGLLAIIAAAFIGGKAMVHNKVKQLRELAKSMDMALMEDSPGGANLTKEEILDIWNDLKALIGI